MNFFKTFFALSVFLIFESGFSACSENTKETKSTVSVTENKESSDTLVFIGETDTIFKTPESVKYDMKNNIFYVSNVNGNPSEKDENGFISKLGKDGEIIDLHWITGLNAPKGTGIFKNKLYVTDIDELVEISIPKGKIIRKYPAKNAQFLNDIDIDDKGNVYVSDMATGTVWILQNGVFTIWLQSDNLISPNGLFCENNDLLIGTKNKILTVNTKTKEIKTLINNTGSIDGLEAAGKGKYIFSDWSGHIYTAKINEKKKLLLNTTNEKINAADIEFIKKENILAVPTFFHNTVSFYELK